MSLLDNINRLHGWTNECRIRLYNVEDDLDWRSVSQYSLEQHEGIGWIAYYNRQVIANLIEAMQYFVYGYTSSFDYVFWYSVHKGLYDKEVSLDWRAICEALVADDFEGKYWFIAIIDRMRQLIWDKPFSIQWAADPKAEQT